MFLVFEQKYFILCSTYFISLPSLLLYQVVFVLFILHCMPGTNSAGWRCVILWMNCSFWLTDILLRILKVMCSSEMLDCYCVGEGGILVSVLVWWLTIYQEVSFIFGLPLFPPPFDFLRKLWEVSLRVDNIYWSSHLVQNFCPLEKGVFFFLLVWGPSGVAQGLLSILYSILSGPGEAFDYCFSLQTVISSFEFSIFLNFNFDRFYLSKSLYRLLNLLNI